MNFLTKIMFGGIITINSQAAIVGFIAKSCETRMPLQGKVQAHEVTMQKRISSQKKSKKATPKYELIAVTQQSTIKESEPLIISLTLKNNSDKTVLVTETANIFYDYMIEVTDNKGSSIALSKKGRGIFNMRDDNKFTLVKIQSGKTVFANLEMSGLYEFRAGSIYLIRIKQNVIRTHDNG